jgi:hypothetical protein
VSGGRSTLSLSSLLLLVHLLSMPLGLLRVLLSEGAVFVCLALMHVDRASQLLSLRRVSVPLLTVSCGFRGKPLSQDPLSLRSVADICDGTREYGEPD